VVTSGEKEKKGRIMMWDFPDKTTGGDCDLLLYGIFLIQGLNLYHLLCLLNCRQILYH